jgi:hypothetical protein
MKVKQAFDEDCHCDSATQEDKPHQRPTLLHVVDHLGHISKGSPKRNCGSDERQGVRSDWRLVIGDWPGKANERPKGFVSGKVDLTASD